MARKPKTLSRHGKVMGRPTKYSPELAAKICDQVAAGGMLTKICEQEGMPARKTVYEWQRADPDFRAAYARAREQWCEHYEEIVLELAFNEAPEPPKQLAYLPSVADEIDQAIVARLVEAIKRHVPRADERPPNEVIEEVADIITSALAAHYRT